MVAVMARHLQRRGELPHPLDHPCGLEGALRVAGVPPRRERAVLLDLVGQRAALGELHKDAELGGAARRVQVLGHVRVVERVEDPHLVVETLQREGVEEVRWRWRWRRRWW